MIPYKLVAIGIGVVGIIYGVYALLAHERDLGYQRCTAEYTTKQLLAEVDARNKETKLIKKVEDAEHAAILRLQDNKKLSDSLADTTRKLRDTTATMRNQLSTNSCETNRATADAAITVFGECAEEYRKVAENAGGHAIDVQRLEERWPDLNEPD
jgi:hypothetical protein